jgi:hypothetical protein
VVCPKYVITVKIYPCFCFLYPVCSQYLLQFYVNSSNVSSFVAFLHSIIFTQLFWNLSCVVVVGFKFSIVVLLILEIFSFMF